LTSTIVLGAGLSGLTLAHELGEKPLVLEKEREPGGLCRSFAIGNTNFDIGPHIIFSNDKKSLSFLRSLVPCRQHLLSSRILFRNSLIPYPFETGLGELPEKEKDFALVNYIENPCAGITPRNLYSFFLKKFGKGITRLYLEPYNLKIWKTHPRRLSLQMVRRIPDAQKNEIIRSASGINPGEKPGGIHFHYPREGGIGSLVSSLRDKIKRRAGLLTGIRMKKIRKKRYWEVETCRGTYTANRMINCMPLHELIPLLENVPDPVRRALASLKYNSLLIAVFRLKKDRIGNCFTVMIPDESLLCHRITRVNYLAASSGNQGDPLLMAELTLSPGKKLPSFSSLLRRTAADLEKSGLMRQDDILEARTLFFPYAYVLYTLDHRRNSDILLTYLKERSIESCGRFAQFEYLNMDDVVKNARELARRVNGSKRKCAYP